MDRAKNVVSKNALLVVVLFIAVVFEIFLRATHKGSLIQPENLTNIISQNGYVVILAVGMLLCILTGGNIDLSVGSIVILVGAVAGFLIAKLKVDIYLSIVICLLCGTALGAWQAFWIAYLRVPPFIVTLAGMLTFRGLALVMFNSLNKGMAIGPFPPSFINLFNSFITINSASFNKFADGIVHAATPEKSGILLISLAIAVLVCLVLVAMTIISRLNKMRKGYSVDSFVWMVVRLVVICAVVCFLAFRLGQNKGIPVLLILLGAVVLVYNYYTQNTVPGRYLYAMGGNEKAALMSGIDTKRTMFFAYTNMGFLSGLASLVVVARFSQASTTAGTGFEMDAIASCFIGGASAYGGIGKVGGAVIGAFFLGVLSMGMSILGADQNVQRVIKGLILLAAAAFDVFSKNSKQAA